MNVETLKSILTQHGNGKDAAWAAVAMSTAADIAYHGPFDCHSVVATIDGTNFAVETATTSDGLSLAVALSSSAPSAPSGCYRHQDGDYDELERLRGAPLTRLAFAERVLAFADSYGRWHAPCGPRHPGCAAFGPTGISAPISKRAAHRLLSAGARLGALPDGAGGCWDCIIGHPAAIRRAR